jgi:hypothetical protein
MLKRLYIVLGPLQIDYDAAHNDCRPSIMRNGFRKSVASISRRRALDSSRENREYIRRAAASVINIRETTPRYSRRLRAFLDKVSNSFYMLSPMVSNILFYAWVN